MCMNPVYVFVMICTCYGLMSVSYMFLYKSDLTLYVFDMTLIWNGHCICISLL